MVIVGRASKQMLGWCPKNDSQNTTRFTCWGKDGESEVTIEENEFKNMPLELQSQDQEGTVATTA